MLPVFKRGPGRVGRVTSAVVGVVFALAAVSKLLSPREFSDALYEAALIPHEWVTSLVIAVPIAELLVSWLLLMG